VGTGARKAGTGSGRTVAMAVPKRPAAHRTAAQRIAEVISTSGFASVQAARDTFERDGAICLRRVASAEEIALLAHGIDRNIADPSPLAVDASQPGDPGRFFEDFCNWERIGEYEHYARTSIAAAVVGQLIGAHTVRLYHDHLLVKEAGTTSPTPWHQDQPYYNVSGRQVVSMWIPVDPVARQSTLEFAGGSHTGEWLMPRTFMTREARWFKPGELREIPDDPQPVLGWDLEPGDAVLFHALTLHRSAGSAERRRVVSFRFLGDDARFSPRTWRTSPPFDGLAGQLQPGDPLDHPLFPVLWSPDSSRRHEV
jgi:ectoine hydroxylase-related dioxygenase (phytanoyl-CoA dioxygenase family)